MNAPRTKLVNFAKLALERYPSLASEWKAEGDGGSVPMEPPVEPPRWCHCSQCRPQNTPEEEICCRKNDGPCITLTSEEFTDVCLNPHVLDVVIRDKNDLYGRNDNSSDNKTLRHTAYRQYVLWRFGRLGVGNRVIVPSCAVWKIRDQFPSTDGQYKGFCRAQRLPVQ